MDFHVLIVIACVFLASFLSLLFINKFFRGKTFEEVAAEKRLLAEKLYGSKSKRNGSNPKKNNNNTLNAAKPNKRKNSNPKASGTGILANKSEPVLVKENLVAEPLNHFEIIHPKDVVELKRQVKEEASTEVVKSQKTLAKESKKPKQIKKEAIEKVESPPQQEAVVATKESKQPDEKLAKQIDSPKIQSKPIKKKKPENPPAPAIRKELPVPTVNSLMSILGRAEFTRGEIQILIDYLLNKQQDTVTNHAEWSDDIVQKLRKKLEEKEKAFEEEQNTSAGIQAKLRELRTTINTERVQHNAAVKAYVEENQSQKLEIQNLTQDMNDKVEKLREQYNLLKMQRINQEEHFNPQLLFVQIEKLNQITDNVKRNAYVGQIVEILQPQNDENVQLKNEIIALRNEIMLLSNDNKALRMNLNEAENNIVCQNRDQEDDKNNMQMQITNLQESLDAANLMQSNTQNHIHNLTTQIDDLNMQLSVDNGKYVEQTNELRTILGQYQTTVQEKDDKLAEYEANIRNLVSKEDELMKQIFEQKEKNNDLRTKNWKLVEALQKAETNAVRSISENLNNLVQPQPLLVGTPQNQDDRLRELLQRLFPEAVASSTGSALSLSFDQWVEQVVAAHTNEIVKEYQAKLTKQAEQLKQVELNNIVNKSNNDHYTTSNHTESINNHKEHSNNGNSNDDIILQNAQLRAQVAELKSVVINTENTLKNLELQALEQDSKWRTVVNVKQEEIDMLKNSNRQAV